jgi:hypothetical protein
VHRVDQVGVEELPHGLHAAAEAHVLDRRPPPSRARSASAGAASTKWNVVSASVNDGRTWWVSTNTGVWNGGTSPHQPCHSWSSHGPALRPELVAAHDLGADVVGEVAGEVVVEPAASARVGPVRPARGGSGPPHQVHRVGVAERPLAGLALPGAVAVGRQGEVVDGWLQPATASGLAPVRRRRPARSVADALGEDRAE